LKITIDITDIFSFKIKRIDKAMLLKKSELFIFLLRCLKIKCLTVAFQECFTLLHGSYKKMETKII